jgi:nitric oxide reductase subunit B
MPGDIIFIGGGILPFLWITWLGIRYRIKTSPEVPQEGSFLEPAMAGPEEDPSASI